jgi:ornithine cyclodeaminase/alanine dehydrogenase-like protein (mu-crystallin family)
VLLLDRATVAVLLPPAEYVAVVEGAFRAHAEGRSLHPGLLHVGGVGGEFHVKAGGLFVGERAYFGLKVNGGFFSNPARGLPAIQGAIYLADATTGTPLALLDSGYITAQRTGAATAVATRYLSRPDARVVTICGAGRQARVQLEAVCRVRPIAQAFVWSRTRDRALSLAAEMQPALGIPVQAVDRVPPADIVVTCTPARAPFLFRDAIAPGSFIAAVGADSPDKQELDTGIFRDAAVICDITEQCAAVGDLHHAIAAGVMGVSDVRGTLGDVITGRVRGRLSADEIVVFDSTGTALQDVAAAAAIYERARVEGCGTTVDLAT